MSLVRYECVLACRCIRVMTGRSGGGSQCLQSNSPFGESLETQGNGRLKRHVTTIRVRRAIYASHAMSARSLRAPPYQRQGFGRGCKSGRCSPGLWKTGCVQSFFDSTFLDDQSSSRHHHHHNHHNHRRDKVACCCCLLPPSLPSDLSPTVNPLFLLIHVQSQLAACTRFGAKTPVSLLRTEIQILAPT